MELPLALRKRIKRIDARLRGEQATVVYGRGYQIELPGVPLDLLRGERILAMLVSEGLVGGESVMLPSPAPAVKLERVHDRAYLERLSSPEVIEATFGIELAPGLAEAVAELQRTMTGGTVLAARTARHRHRLAINLGGGFHHAHRDRGRGFCLLNDIAVAIADLRAKGFAGPIAVIDLDVHDGDGTRSLFADDPSVWTFSIHNAHWESTEAVSSTAIALGEAVGDDDYLRTLREHLPPVLDRHRPALVFYLAGCDPAADDQLGNWQISDEGMLERDCFVLDCLRARGIDSVVWLLGGGYGSDAWRHSARGLIACLGGPRHPQLPTTEAITSSRFRMLAEILDPEELSGRAPGELSFDESDLLGAVGLGHQGPPRVLGFYTLAGVELALERYGLLPRLRGLGFEPRVTIDIDSVDGDTVRVYGDAGKELVLIELRVRRDQQTVVGHQLLRIEWLLLQNPRASWTAGRVALPGQRHPGLRMFDEVSIMMLMICERLHLDGIVVVPSHYHVAARWHGRMHFLDPRDEGRFRALRTLLADLPLDEASAAVEQGRVVDLDSDEPGGYRPAPLIMPAGEILQRRFDEDWEREAAAAEAEARFELRSRWA
ncbi:MAG: histone deacetylase [Myxococcales bacterium]|nr:histone deacetylase [Myxococcales bacterium]